MAKTAKGRSQEAIKRAVTAQQERSPMLSVRIPRSLYRALRQAARADQRQFPDWMRLNLPRLLNLENRMALPIAVYSGPQSDESEPTNG